MHDRVAEGVGVIVIDVVAWGLVLAVVIAQGLWIFAVAILPAIVLAYAWAWWRDPKRRSTEVKR